MTATDCEGVGKREAWRLNRNLQKDHCTTCLCCGALRNMKLRFSCHLSMSEYFIHCFSIKMPGTLGKGWGGLAGGEDPCLEVCSALQSCEGAAVLPWVHSIVPCQVLCPISSHHISLWGSQLIVTGGKATHEEKNVPFLLLSSEIEHGCKTPI